MTMPTPFLLCSSPFLFLSLCRSERRAPPDVLERRQVLSLHVVGRGGRRVPLVPPAVRQGEEAAVGGHGLRPPEVLPVHVQEAGLPRLPRQGQPRRRQWKVNAKRG